MKKIISTTNAPAAIGPYSQAIDCGNFLVTSGQIPFDPATGEFVPGGITEQTRQVLTNIKAILTEAGLTMDNVVKTTVFLQNMGDFAAMNAVYAEFFTEGQYPARSAVEVGALPKGCAGGDRNHLRKVNRYRKGKRPPGASFCICTAFLNISQIFLSIFADNPWKMLDFRYFMCYTVCII